MLPNKDISAVAHCASRETKRSTVKEIGELPKHMKVNCERNWRSSEAQACRILEREIIGISNKNRNFMEIE